MGQKLSMFIDSQLARANFCEEQAKIERGILEALEDWYDEMKDRSCGHGVERDEKKAIRARKHPPPFLNPQRIVSDETIQHWRTIARQDDPIIKEYIHQALKVPLTQLLEAPNLCDILTETSLSRQSHRLLAHLVIKRE